MKKGQYVDISGQRFGRLVAKEIAGKMGSRTLWLCECDCGSSTVVSISNLRNGHTRSCGCLVIDACIAAKKTHGGKGKYKQDRLYNVWRAMKQRCCRETDPTYKWYGANGVQVCDLWQNSYEAFRNWSYEHGYDDKAPRGVCTIDRIDPYGNYEPANCRWVSMAVQGKNKRIKKTNEEGELS